jgi:hypothetical protein
MSVPRAAQAFHVCGNLYKKRGGFGGVFPNAWHLRFFAATKEGILMYFDEPDPANAHVSTGLFIAHT